jgi:hypothetical protein
MPKQKLPQAVEKMQNIILPQAAGEMKDTADMQQLAVGHKN